MSDTRVPADVIAQVRARSGQSEISHAAAREVVATFVVGTGITRTFVETGEIAHPSDVWRDLFGYGVYSRLTTEDSMAADALGTYLTARTDTGPVVAWSALTLSD